MMNIERSAWAPYIAEFNTRNQSRPTWLQVLGEGGAQSQEDGLLLFGISLEEKGSDAPRVQIMLAGQNTLEARHMTHVIANLEHVSPTVGTDGRDDAIEFVDKRGEASLLIFRHRARMAAHA